MLLAAGSSSRFGRPKQLAYLHGETLLRRAARTLREVCTRVIVVIPPDADAMRAEVADLAVEIVENAQAEEGIASSIRAGVAAADRASVLIALCDQPLITAKHLARLLEGDAPIAATAYAGIAGVPARFSAAYVPELLALAGDRGARIVIEAHRDVAELVPFAGAAVDVDTETQLSELS